MFVQVKALCNNSKEGPWSDPIKIVTDGMLARVCKETEVGLSRAVFLLSLSPIAGPKPIPELILVQTPPAGNGRTVTKQATLLTGDVVRARRRTVSNPLAFDTYHRKMFYISYDDSLDYCSDGCIGKSSIDPPYRESMVLNSAFAMSKQGC